MARHRESLCTTAAEEHLLTSSLGPLATPKNHPGSESNLRNSASLTGLGHGSLESDGFAGDVSSPIRDPLELEMSFSEPVRQADGNSQDSCESIPSISQFEFTRTQQSLLDWADNLSQSRRECEAEQQASRRDFEDFEAAAAAMDAAIKVTAANYAPVMSPSDTMNPLSPPVATQSQPGPVNDTDMQDLDIVWYQERVVRLEAENSAYQSRTVQLEAQLASYRARDSLWNRLAVTMAEHASDIGDTLNEAVMWGVDQIEMPSPPARFKEPDAFGFRKDVE